MSWWSDRVEARCREVADAGRWRAPRSFDASGVSGVLAGSGPVVSFAGNDYLGLSHHPAVVEAARAALVRWGAGSGASRLITGSRPVHHELEAALAAHRGTEAAVLFPTGFAANLAVLTTFGEPGVRICSDAWNHASIVDGARLARAEVCVYRHADVDHLRELVDTAPGPVLVVTDTVFSMDGDHAPLADIAGCCRRAGALLVLDEAHAVLGPDPAPHLDGVDHVRVGTLSKTLGSLGGYAATGRRFAELLVNRGRPYIFTTAPAPADAAAALAALGVLTSPEGDRLRRRLAANVDRLRPVVAALGVPPPPGVAARHEPGGTAGGAGRAAAPGAASPIVPVVLGDEEAALAAAAALLERGLWVPAIRPPTVPAGTARLRVTLSADHRPEDVDALAEAMSEVVAAAAVAR